MAKSKAYKGSENVAAALDSLDGVSVTVAKSTSVVKRRIEELDEIVGDLEQRMTDLEDSHRKEIQDMKEQYTIQNTTLQTKLDAAEEKLRKVQQTLA